MGERRSNEEAKPSDAISDEDRQAVSELASGSAKVLHEVIRLKGNEELDRPIKSLLLSGFAAGVGISSSLLAEASLRMRLPETDWSDLVIALGYTSGFVIVILGSLQLFTETTVTAVLPLATHPTVRNLRRLFRLWTAVLAANMLGTLLVAGLMSFRVIVTPELLAAALTLSERVQAHSFGTTLLLATPAGFLIASIAWMLPNARGSEFWVVVLITYVISIGGFSHVVAGSTEAWLLMFCGKTTFFGALAGFVIPALLGNIVGGTGLFAIVAHGQVRDELKS